MPSISVIGAAGAVGRTTVKQLLAADESIHVVALLRQHDPELAGLDRCDVIVGGLFDFDALERAAWSTDLMINLAARNPGGASDWKARQDFFLINGLGAGLVAATAERHQLPLVHFSTVSVYETAAYSPGRLMTENELMPCLGEEEDRFFKRALAFLSEHVTVERPRSTSGIVTDDLKKFLDTQSYPDSIPVYGLSKLIGEVLVLNTCRRVCCIRMSDVFGPGHESRGVVIDHLTPLAKRKPLFVDFGLRSAIYFIYIDDVARMLGLLIDRLRGGGRSLPRVMNFCGKRIDSTTMMFHLRGICAEHGLRHGIQIAPPIAPQFDRRYSEEVFDRSLPAFDKTEFSTGLRLAFDALAAEIAPCGSSS